MKYLSSLLFPQDFKLLYFDTSSSIHAVNALGRRSESRKGGDPRDDLLMFVYRSFVQMHAQHKGSLKPDL